MMTFTVSCGVVIPLRLKNIRTIERTMKKDLDKIANEREEFYIMMFQ
jgi:hypothetical protein